MGGFSILMGHPVERSPLEADDDEGVWADAERDGLDVAEPVAHELAERPVAWKLKICPHLHDTS